MSQAQYLIRALFRVVDENDNVLLETSDKALAEQRIAEHEQLVQVKNHLKTILPSSLTEDDASLEKIAAALIAGKDQVISVLGAQAKPKKERAPYGSKKSKATETPATEGSGEQKTEEASAGEYGPQTETSESAA